MTETGLTARLKQFVQELGLSQSQFADSLEVQRSTMSHLFSGRNKPSISLIVKITETYPQLNIQWLLHGKGDILIGNASETDSTDGKVTPVNIVASSDGKDAQSTAMTNDASAVKSATETQLGNQENLENKLVQMVLVYSDGSVRLVEV